MVLVVSPTLQVNSVQELVAFAKANPGKLNYGATVGTPPHMAWGLFTMLTGTDIVYVPYKGAAAAFTDLVAGQIQMNFDATGSLLPLIREGKLKALAVSSASRNPDLPEVPTMVESGIDFLMSFWTAVLAPVGTPPDIVSKLNATINAGLGSAEMKATLAKFQVEAKAGSAQDFAAFLARRRRNGRMSRRPRISRSNDNSSGGMRSGRASPGTHTIIRSKHVPCPSKPN
jgi:tripartite-type tricarboxylate transporter receptor subunit TctC